VRRGGRLEPATWGEAFAAAAEAVRGRRVAALAGDLAPAEAIYALRELTAALGGVTECRTDGAALPAGNRSGYVGNARIADLDTARAILIIGSNPRSEAPVLNARIRKAWTRGAEVGMIGMNVDLSYLHHQVGTGPAALTGEARERPVKGLSAAEGAAVIVLGQGALRRADGAAVLGEVMALAEETGAKLLVLHTAASRVAAMDLNFVTEGGIGAALDEAEVIYNLGADEIDIAPGPFVIYQGSHGDRGAHRADVILPGAAYTEESGIFVNTEGRPQMANRAGFPPGQARENWAILRALSAQLGSTLPFDTLAELRMRMLAAVPHLAALDVVPENARVPVPRGEVSAAAFAPGPTDHYQANPITRASEVMAELTRLASLRARPLAAE
jgi:NADH-quinone oxidoreductase subunit G